MTEGKKKVLFVEDDPVDRMALERMIRAKALQYEFKVVTSVAEAILALSTQQFDLIVTDFYLGDGDAIEVVRAAPNIASIITTGTGDQITAVKAIKEGVYEYLVKDPARHYLEILPHTMDSVLAQHEARMAIKRLEGRYKALSDSSPLGIFSTDEQGNCNYVNSRYQEISGLSAEQCVGQGWSTAIHPEDRERVRVEWHKATSENGDYVSTHRFMRPDGSVSWCSVKAAAVREDNRVTGYVGTVEDITARKEAEDRLKLATSAAQIGIWQWNIKDNSLIWDDSMLAIYGIEKSRFKGAYESWASALSAADQEEAQSRLMQAVKGERVFDPIFQITRSDGSTRHIKATGIVEREHDGKAIRIIGTNVDITQLKEREAELEHMRCVAETATHTKSQFLANMSHEIRTPLTSIIGFAEAAKEDGVCPSERVTALETILSNGKHLLGVINDILDLSKIDAGALKVESVPLSPVSIVENVRMLMVPRLAEKELSLIVNYKWELPQTITSDSLRLTQILVNLVSNAVKFTEHGCVELSVWCESEKEELHFSVSDTGIGLTAEQISCLCQPFSQAEAGTTRKYGGTGLGLSISKQLIERLGGELSIESEPNVGSKFSFFVKTGLLRDTAWISSVPLQSEDAPSEEKVVRKLISGRVLIADDAADNRNLIKFTLRKTDLEMTFVENGEEALKEALTEQFDLILLDMQMPVMDGYTAAREIRKNGIQIPIVAFTANTMKHDVLKCVEAGCTTHLPKPFGKEALFECLYQQLKGTHLLEVSEDMVISEKFTDDPEALDIVLDFVEGLDARLEALVNALEHKDFLQLEAVAHSLSGSSGLFGYSQLSELATNLEAAAKEGELLHSQELFRGIQNTYQQILKGVSMMKNSAPASQDSDRVSKI